MTSNRWNTSNLLTNSIRKELSEVNNSSTAQRKLMAVYLIFLKFWHFTCGAEKIQINNTYYYPCKVSDWTDRLQNDRTTTYLTNTSAKTLSSNSTDTKSESLFQVLDRLKSSRLSASYVADVEANLAKNSNSNLLHLSLNFTWLCLQSAGIVCR